MDALMLIILYVGWVPLSAAILGVLLTLVIFGWLDAKAGRDAPLTQPDTWAEKFGRWLFRVTHKRGRE